MWPDRPRLHNEADILVSKLRKGHEDTSVLFVGRVRDGVLMSRHLFSGSSLRKALEEHGYLVVVFVMTQHGPRSQRWAVRANGENLECFREDEPNAPDWVLQVANEFDYSAIKREERKW